MSTSKLHRSTKSNLGSSAAIPCESPKVIVAPFLAHSARDCRNATRSRRARPSPTGPAMPGARDARRVAALPCSTSAATMATPAQNSYRNAPLLCRGRIQYPDGAQFVGTSATSDGRPKTAEPAASAPSDPDQGPLMRTASGSGLEPKCGRSFEVSNQPLPLVNKIVDNNSVDLYHGA